MRIQHNIAALNSYRNLTGNNNAVSKNLEKLSSGYRINRAGDDAAGLAISEKMRAQITGLNTAQKGRSCDFREDARTDYRTEHCSEERTGRRISGADCRRRSDRSTLHVEPYGRTG